MKWLEDYRHGFCFLPSVSSVRIQETSTVRQQYLTPPMFDCLKSGTNAKVRLDPTHFPTREEFDFDTRNQSTSLEWKSWFPHRETDDRSGVDQGLLGTKPIETLDSRTKTEVLHHLSQNHCKGVLCSQGSLQVVGQTMEVKDWRQRFFARCRSTGSVRPDSENLICFNTADKVVLMLLVQRQTTETHNRFFNNGEELARATYMMQDQLPEAEPMDKSMQCLKRAWAFHERNRSGSWFCLSSSRPSPNCLLGGLHPCSLQENPRKTDRMKGDFADEVAVGAFSKQILVLRMQQLLNNDVQGREQEERRGGSEHRKNEKKTNKKRYSKKEKLSKQTARQVNSNKRTHHDESKEWRTNGVRVESDMIKRIPTDLGGCVQQGIQSLGRNQISNVLTNRDRNTEITSIHKPRNKYSIDCSTHQVAQEGVEGLLCSDKTRSNKQSPWMLDVD